MLKQHSATSRSMQQVSLDTMIKIDPRLERFPSTLNYYISPPQDQITLKELETVGLGRLNVLLAIQSARLRAKSDEDIRMLIEPVLNKHLELKRNTTVNAIGLFDQRLSDHISHFILRLAYCKTPDLQAWFLKQETTLFKFRFQLASSEEREVLIKQSNMQLQPCSFDELVEIMAKGSMEDGRQKYHQTIKAVYNGDHASFYKVPFESVLELVGRRQTLLYDGFAFVPESEIVLLVTNEFRTHLAKELKFTAKRLPSLDEDDRIMLVLTSLAKQSLSREYTITSTGEERRAEDIAQLSQHFPLCMSSLQSTLKNEAHLKHQGRIQYGLFLKAIGLSLEEALIFWRRSFSRMSDDEFNKKGYPYNIRYNYGQEGKRTNYTPYSCVKMIQSLPGPQESHGCPFRSCNSEKLTDLILQRGVDAAGTANIVQKAKDGHYQVACTKLFELSRRKGDESIVAESIEHPNSYFDLSIAANK